MKLPNIKDLEGVKMFFRRKWYELSRSNARFFAFGLATGTFFTLLSLRFIGSFGTIHEALVAIDSGGRIQYFTSIGAAVLGVLAITFSLAVFALQHAAEHGSVRILEAFGNSRRVLFDYVLIGSIAFLVYILGLTPQQNNYFTSISLLLSLALIIVVLWRVFAFYKFIVKFINPVEQIRDLSREAKKILLKARELLLQIRTIEETPVPPEDGPTAGIDAEDLFVTANFDHDNIFLPYNSHVISLVDRMRVYAGKERHEVTLQGYRELIDIASTYFSVRKYSTASAGMFVQDARTDKYLVLLLEQLKSLFSQVIKMEDQEGLQQNFYCHIGIAVRVANYKILGRDVANPNLNFVIGYLHRNLLEALRKNVDDAVLNGVRYLQTITAQIPSNHYLTMSQLADHFKEEAVMSIAVQKWYITQETVNGLVGIVVWSLSDSFRTSLTLKSTLKHLSEVARYYVGSGLSVDINGGGLSSAIAVVNQNSIPYILNEHLVRTWEKDGAFDEDVFEEFCDYYDALGKIAAESGSFLMHFVLSALNVHIEQLVRLRWHKDQKNADQFLEGIKRTLRSYRSIYSYLPEDYEDRKFGYLEFERVKEVALWAAKEKDEGIFTAVVETFIFFYKQSRKKTRDEFTALRLYVDLVELGAIASGSGMEEVANKLVNMATEVQKEQMEIHAQGEIPAKYREELEERLSREIWRLYDDYRQYNPMRHDDIKLESFISREDLMKFLNRIELLVYKREITERRSSMF